jgi:hypothetical protein
MIRLELFCQNCLRMQAILISEDTSIKITCSDCGRTLGSATPALGLLYALRNKSMPGLLKIGFTTRPIEERVSELNSSTSTPQPFETAFLFTSDSPQEDESLVHEMLASFRLSPGREFFQIDEKDALFLLRKILSQQEVYASVRTTNIESNDKISGQSIDSYNSDATFSEKLQYLRSIWSSTGDKQRGISFIYCLMHNQRYIEALEVVNLFLQDNPGHGVAQQQKSEILAFLKSGSELDRE